MAARGDALRRGVRDIMVIGGADLYGQTMDAPAALEITHVHARPAGDTRVPRYRPGAVARDRAPRMHPAGPDDDAPLHALSYERVLRGVVT